MIEFKESSHVWQLWFVGAKGVDWLAVLMRQEGEGWTCTYRFRYHKDDKVFDSEDEKSWTRLVTDSQDETPPEDLIKAIGMVARMTAIRYGGEIHSMPVRGNGIDAMKVYADQPWAYMKVIPASEIKP